MEILSGFQMNCEPCYVQVQVKGLNADELKNGVFMSKIVANGLKPNFNLLMDFNLVCPELAFILVQVYHKNYTT